MIHYTQLTTVIINSHKINSPALRSRKTSTIYSQSRKGVWLTSPIFCLWNIGYWQTGRGENHCLWFHRLCSVHHAQMDSPKSVVENDLCWSLWITWLNEMTWAWKKYLWAWGRVDRVGRGLKVRVVSCQELKARSRSRINRGTMLFSYQACSSIF